MFLPKARLTRPSGRKSRTVRQKLEIQTRSKTGDLVLYTYSERERAIKNIQGGGSWQLKSGAFIGFWKLSGETIRVVKRRGGGGEREGGKIKMRPQCACAVVSTAREVPAARHHGI